jgi:hypothetical protein
VSSESWLTGKVLTYLARLQSHRPTPQQGSRQGQHRESFDETSAYTFQLRYVLMRCSLAELVPIPFTRRRRATWHAPRKWPTHGWRQPPGIGWPGKMPWSVGEACRAEHLGPSGRDRKCCANDKTRSWLSEVRWAIGVRTTGVKARQAAQV